MKIPKLARHRLSQSLRGLISMYVCMYVYLICLKKTITIDFMESYTGTEKEI